MNEALRDGGSAAPAAPAAPIPAASVGCCRRLLRSGRFRAALAVAGLVAVVAGVGGRKAFVYSRTDPTFCRSCHLMEDAFSRWQASLHKDVACQTCHRAGIFEEAQLGLDWLTKRPAEVGPHTKLDASICAECHRSGDASWTQIAATPGHRVHVEEKGLSCLECHATKLHVFEADAVQCQRCHGADKLVLTKMSDLHCMGCHDFVQGDASGALIPGSDDCRRCHTADGAPAADVAARHPALVGKPVPVAKGHEDCRGCHRPHGPPLDDPIDCLRCHRALLEGGKHLEDERIAECKECHAPHERRP